MVLTVVQRDWRFYSDETPDSSMVALANEDTAPDLSYRYINNGIMHLRVRLAETGGTAGTNSTIVLQYSRDGTTWQNVAAQGTSTGEHWIYADGMASDGTNVSTLLLTDSATAGEYHETGAGTQSIAANETGLEVDFTFMCHWATTGTWQFRVLFAGAEAAVDSGFTRPSVTITGANRTHHVTSVGNKPTAEGLTEETRMGDQKRCWFDGDRYWYFYTESTTATSIFYRHWSGSGEWSSPASLSGLSDGTNDGRWRMWCENINGTYTVFLLTGNNQGNPANRFLYKGTISGTTITWGSEQTLSGNFGDEGNAIGVDAGGYVWVGGVTNGGGSVWARRSTNPNDITAFEAAVTLTDAGADETRPFYIVGLASQKALCIWYDSTDTDIHSSVVTTSFAAFAVVNASAAAHDQDFGFTYDRANGFVYVAHTDSVTNGAGNVLLRAFSTGSETWASCTTPPTGAGNRPFGGDDHLPVQLLNNGRLACYFTVLSNGEDRQVGYLLYSGRGTSGTWETNASHLSPPRLSNLDRITTVGPGPAPDRMLAFVASGDEPNVSSTVDIEWWDEHLVDPHPYFMRSGTAAGGTGAVSPAWPAHQVGDVALLIVESANETISLSTPAGFVEVPDSPIGTGTAAGTAATRLAVFWCRATSAAMATPTVADPGNHAVAQIVTYRRVKDTGNPWNVTASGVDASGSRNIAVPGDTTTLAKCLAVLIASNPFDVSTGQTNSWNNGDLSDFVFCGHTQSSQGNGGGFGHAAGYLAAPGSFGTTNGRLVNSGVQAFLAIALQPSVTMPVGLGRRPLLEDSEPDLPRSARSTPFLFGAPPAAPPAFPFQVLRRPLLDELPPELPAPSHAIAFLFAPPVVQPAFPFEVLARSRSQPLDDPEAWRQPSPAAFLFPQPAAPPTFPFSALRRFRVAELDDDLGRPAALLPFLFAPPVAAPAFAVELLSRRPAHEDLLEHAPLRRPLDWLWPPPPPPPPFDVSILRRFTQEPEPEPERIPYRPLAGWLTFPPAQVLGVVTCGSWPVPVLFNHCDEYRVRLSGPSCANPRARVVLGFQKPS